MCIYSSSITLKIIILETHNKVCGVMRRKVLRMYIQKILSIPYSELLYKNEQYSFDILYNEIYNLKLDTLISMTIWLQPMPGSVRVSWRQDLQVGRAGVPPPRPHG